jgi:lipid A disaccharide synthetase
MKNSTDELNSADHLAPPVVVAVDATEFQFRVLEKLKGLGARMDMIFIKERQP